MLVGGIVFSQMHVFNNAAPEPVNALYKVLINKFQSTLGPAAKIFSPLALVSNNFSTTSATLSICTGFGPPPPGAQKIDYPFTILYTNLVTTVESGPKVKSALT